MLSRIQMKTFNEIIYIRLKISLNLIISETLVNILAKIPYFFPILKKGEAYFFPVFRGIFTEKFFV